jgi:hypothetical protein
MPQLSKAVLQEIDNRNQAVADGKRVSVQFNPATLRLQYSNQSEGGRSAGRQARQHTGSGATTLSVELVFDTADEGDTDAPSPVLARTQEVEYFITPRGSGARNQAPPRVSFQWGTLRIDGVLESLSVDLQHFAHDGTALRAKASLSIKEQDPEVAAGRRGAGGNTAVGATPAAAAGANPALPGATGATGATGAVGAGLLGGIGTVLGGLNNGGMLTRALQGESLSQLAARNGLSPEAWRALSRGVANPSSLPAGQPVAVPATAGTAPGLGATQAAQSGQQQGVAQRVGVSPAGTGATPAGAALQRGHALSDAGGLGAALETVRADQAQQGAARARQAFGGAGSTAPDPISTAAATPGQRNEVFALRADPRAASFGTGVPLRDRVQLAHDERANLLSGQARVKRAGDGLPPRSSNPAVPGWVALPLAPSTPLASHHDRGCRCGCGS